MSQIVKLLHFLKVTFKNFNQILTKYKYNKVIILKKKIYLNHKFFNYIHKCLTIKIKGKYNLKK